MKKYFILLFALSVLLSGCTYQAQETVTTATTTKAQENNVYTKSLWLTYYELEGLTKGKSEEEFKSGFTKLLNVILSYGFNTITVQVRPCADAFYKSSYYPTSIYFQGKQGTELIYDPLAIICELAKEANISVEAWVNPFRVSQNNDFESLSNDNIALKWRGTNKVFAYNKKIYFNPCYEEVQNLIVNGVEEIVKNYSVSAIHFDDYFYPTTDKSIDANEYKSYKQQGGELSLANWRRNNINDLIRKVYFCIKNINKSVSFGVSPMASIKDNYSKQYADVSLWCNNEGYIDYICPQIYYGFKNENMPFMQTVKNWIRLVDTNIVDLYVGLPLYKSNKIDKYASSSSNDAINEFKNATNIISRQVVYLSKINDIDGFYVFSYSNLISTNNEAINLKQTMQNSNPRQY